MSKQTHPQLAPTREETTNTQFSPHRTTNPGPFPLELARDLKLHLALCQEAMTLTARENQALSGPAQYEASEFCRQRKDLLPRLEQSLTVLRGWRQAWQKMDLAERAGCSEIRSLFQAAQGLLMKVLLLDRENQQAMLRRGLLPARHLPAPAAQQPHCVADLYRRHARSASPQPALNAAFPARS